MPGSNDPILPATLANVARGAWDGVSRHHPIFAKLRAKGRFEFDVNGGSDGSLLNGNEYELSGTIEAGRYLPSMSAPGKDISNLYEHKVRAKRWTGVFGEIVNALPLSRGALRRNAGSTLMDLSKTEIPAACRDTIEADGGLSHQILQMNAEAYTGSDLPIYGLPTFLPGNGVNGASAYAMATAIAAYDLEGFTPPTGSGSGTLTGSAPADTDMEVAIGGAPTLQNYLGLSLKPGALVGVDAPEWDAWTPTLVNSSYTGWTGTADDEDDAIEKVLQYAVFRGSRFSSGNLAKKPNMGLLDRLFFQYLGQKKAARENIFVLSSKRGTDVPDSGYPVDKIFHAGLEWCWDEHMPTETAFVFPAEQMKVKVQKLYRGLAEGHPLKISGEEAGILETQIVDDPYRRQWLFNATFPGQVICNPRYFVRVSNYS